MSTLILVRHGQATPFEADTDRLSPTGEAQAREVGAFLAREETPTRVITGPMVRQRHTTELAREAAGRAGAAWPEPTVDPRLAEYDGDGIIRTLAPLLAAQDETFASLGRAFEERRDAPDRNRHFQRLLEALMDRHVRGDVTHPDVETWAAFKARVQAALRDVLSAAGGQHVLVFTSGGVIGLAVARTLDAPDAAALRLNWRVKNASVTRFTFGSGGSGAARVSLDSFNECGHLTPAHVTFR